MSESSTITAPRKFSGLITLVLIINLFFLTYLALTSQLIIFHDSIGYQNIAEMFLRGQWREFFLMGPGREPLYSLLIAFSMSIAGWQNLDYLAVVVSIQIFILILSQCLTYKLLQKMNISDEICAVALAYMGVSPALTSSGLILFSEIITYPLVLWFVLSLSRAWTQFSQGSIRQSLKNGLMIALPAFLITMTKGAFELIIPVVLIPFLWKAFQAYRQKQITITFQVLVMFAAIFCGLQLPVMAYKKANHHFNGVWALTGRAPEALYGNTARRMLPLSGERIQTALAYMAGPDVCSRLHGEKCLPWAFLASDILGADKTASLRAQGLTRKKMDKICIWESIPHIMKNPLQYFVLSLIEASKIFFWEAPEISYVVYSDGVDKTYNAQWLRYPLRFVMALACLWAIVWSGRHLWINRKKIFTLNKDTDGQLPYIFFTFFVIVVFIAIHSFFFILPRYALPIAPLFLALIAWQWNILSQKQKRQ